MIPRTVLDLTAAEELQFLAALAESHRIRVTLRVHDRNENQIKDIVPQIISGAVQVDANADVSRSLNLQLLDAQHRLQFDSTNPADGALYADNFVSVMYGVEVEALDRWVDVPVFFGVVTRFQRNGAEVTLEAQGKEALGLDPHLVTRHYTMRRGATVQAVIRRVMGEIGEARFAIGMLAGKLRKARAVVPGEQPWRVLTGGDQDGSGKPKPPVMARANGNFLLFYDGRGYLTAKRRNQRTIFTFRHDAHVLTRPGYDFDVLAFRNHAEVLGGDVKGASKRRARGEYTLPAAHPLSPAALSRNGHGRFLTIMHEADTLKTDAACRRKARQLVEAQAFQGVSANFDSLPIPTLEELDTVTLDMGTYQLTFRLTNFTIPLTADQPMAIGFNRRAALPMRGRA